MTRPRCNSEAVLSLFKSGDRTLVMKKKHIDLDCGFSILELLLVLVIASILAAFALTSLGRANENMDRQNLARHFKVSLERARFDSVKRRATSTSGPTAMANVKIINETKFIVTTDVNQDGVIGTNEFRTASFPDRNGIRLLVDSGITYPVTIYFDRRGHATIVDGSGNPTSKFIFCGSACSFSTSNNSNSNQIIISATGTVAMMGGSDSISSVPDPDVTTVSSTQGINPDVMVWNPGVPGLTPTPSPTGVPLPSPSISPIPSPSPSPSPTAFPTPTPTPTPTPMGTPLATPTPTPTPSPTPLPACVKNQRPGNPPTCQCNSPWFIAKNGKCGP